MKFTKMGMRIWITLAAMISFFGGWAFFANSRQPVEQSSTAATQDQFPQNQAFNPRHHRGDDFQSQQGRMFPFSQNNQPRFRSGGS